MSVVEHVPASDGAGAGVGAGAGSGAGAGAGAGAGSVSPVSSLRAAESPQGLPPLASSMNRDELVIEVERQRRLVTVLQGEVKKLRASAAQMASRNEYDEEMLANRLMKRMAATGGGGGGRSDRRAADVRSSQLERQLQQLKRDKIDVEHKLEQEQEFLVNKLQKQMRELLASKADLERRLEAEKKRVNATPTHARQLQARLRQVQREKVALENQLEAEQEAIVLKLQKKLREAIEAKSALQQRLSADSSGLCSAVFASLDALKREVTLQQGTMVDRVRRDVESLCQKLTNVQAQLTDVKRESSTKSAEISRLQQENFVLQQRVSAEQERAASVQGEASRMAASLEADSERHFNEMSRGSIQSDSGGELDYGRGRARAESVENITANSARFIRSASGTHLAAAAGSITPIHSGGVNNRSPSPAPAAVAAAMGLQDGADAAARHRRASFQALFDDDLDALVVATSGGSGGGFGPSPRQPLGHARVSGAGNSSSARALAALTHAGSGGGGRARGVADDHGRITARGAVTRCPTSPPRRSASGGSSVLGSSGAPSPGPDMF